jgi:uncharacterized membrane protein
MNAIAVAADRRAYRMTSVDILRGLVIVLMALDHVRDYMMVGSMQDPTADSATGPLLFATRWVTHFCAPTFAFLAGASAGLMAQRKSPSSLARFLVLRGLWLIVVEVYGRRPCRESSRRPDAIPCGNSPPRAPQSQLR